jgi:inward rectifier potassium channel
MQKVTFDPGLTQQYTGPLRRAINQDGTFNALRRGTDWRDVHPYLHLVSIPLHQFLAIVVGFYMLVVAVFAVIYYALGPGALQAGTESGRAFDRLLQCVFFSSQTLTTVGYGAIAPHNTAANVVAAFEALFGLLGFAVATGLLFGRVSRPSAGIGFSERALIAPYQDGFSFQFRVVNRRANSLIEPEATVLMMTAVRADGTVRREYKFLKLEREKILFFPLPWTIVHPIDAESPLFGKTAADLEDLQAEFMILVKAWDETFSQTVHQRFSYRYNELVWGGRFTPAFTVDDQGDLHVHVDRIGSYVTPQALQE